MASKTIEFWDDGTSSSKRIGWEISSDYCGKGLLRDGKRFKRYLASKPCEKKTNFTDLQTFYIPWKHEKTLMGLNGLTSKINTISRIYVISSP